MVKLLMLYKNTLIKELKSPRQEISRCHVNISKNLHGRFSLTRHTNLSKLKTSLARKIFDTMTSPILKYNSEIWGVYAKPDFFDLRALPGLKSSQIEKTHLQFCKRLKEVNSKASNVACKAELEYILALRIIKKVV